MAMQIIENWTCVTGIVLACSQPIADKKAEGVSERTQLELKVEATRAVAGVKSLLHENSGDTLLVMMPSGFRATGKSLLGRKVTLPVRMAKPGHYFADPDWSPEKGSARCGPNPGP